MQVASGNLTQDWTTLISLLSEDPVTRMRLILDPLNEPDQLHIGWTRNATDSLPGYEEVLTEVFGAVYPINPYMLLLVQVRPPLVAFSQALVLQPPVSVWRWSSACCGKGA